MGLCSSYPNDARGQQSSAESALSEGRHTSPECNCPRNSLWHGQSGHQHHQRLLSIQKKDLIPENWTKAAWRILHLGCPLPLRAHSMLISDNFNGAVYRVTYGSARVGQ